MWGFRVSGLHRADGGRRGLRSPARVAGGHFGFAMVAASTPQLARPLCGNRKCDLRPQTPPPAVSGVCGQENKKSLPPLRCAISRRLKVNFFFVQRSTTPLGWWIGYPFIGPIRGGRRAGAPESVLANNCPSVNRVRPRAWARERIPGPPALPTPRLARQFHSIATNYVAI